MDKTKRVRADHQGTHRSAYHKNKLRILHTQDVCAICGRYVDKSLKYPDLMSATVDHIIPLNKGGHPSDMANLQLAHFICNRLKSDKLFENKNVALKKSTEKIYQSRDWKSF